MPLHPASGTPRSPRSSVIRGLVYGLVVSVSAAASAMGGSPSGDAPPQPLKLPSPGYPKEFVNAGFSATVLVRFAIDAQGVPTDVRIQQTDNPGFDRAAIEGAQKWRFRPGMKDGRAVATLMEVPMNFAVEDAKPLWAPTRPEVWSSDVPEDFRWDEAPIPKTTRGIVMPIEELLKNSAHAFPVRVVVNPEGRVSEVTWSRVIPPLKLQHAIRAMFANWTFTPAKKAGAPSFAAVTVAFNLAQRTNNAGGLSRNAAEILAELRRQTPRIVPFENLDAPPATLRRTEPVTPAWLENSSQTGSAMIQFFVDRNGDVQLPEILQATDPEIGALAAQAVSAWRFSPPLQKGKPVIASSVVTLNFTAARAASAGNGR